MPRAASSELPSWAVWRTSFPPVEDLTVRRVVLDHSGGHSHVGAASGPAELPEFGSGLVVLVDDRLHVEGVHVARAVSVDGLADVLGQFTQAGLVLGGDGVLGLLEVGVLAHPVDASALEVRVLTVVACRMRAPAWARNPQGSGSLPALSTSGSACQGDRLASIASRREAARTSAPTLARALIAPLS